MLKGMMNCASNDKASHKMVVRCSNSTNLIQPECNEQESVILPHSPPVNNPPITKKYRTNDSVRLICQVHILD